MLAMLTARGLRRVRGLQPFCGRGWRAVEQDGEPGLRRCRSGGGGQCPQPGQNLGQQAIAGREPQDRDSHIRRAPSNRSHLSS